MNRYPASMFNWSRTNTPINKIHLVFVVVMFIDLKLKENKKMTKEKGKK